MSTNLNIFLKEYIEMNFHLEVKSMYKFKVTGKMKKTGAKYSMLCTTVEVIL